jgi:hypothetical protein
MRTKLLSLTSKWVERDSQVQAQVSHQGWAEKDAYKTVIAHQSGRHLDHNHVNHYICYLPANAQNQHSLITPVPQPQQPECRTVKYPKPIGEGRGTHSSVTNEILLENVSQYTPVQLAPHGSLPVQSLRLPSVSTRLWWNAWSAWAA